MQSQWGSGYGYGAGGTGASGGYGSDSGGGGALMSSERGSRRKKIAAMAGSVYRAGAAAASEIRDQYNNTRIRNLDLSDHKITIPGAFPDAAIVVQGDSHMVLFPSYAKRHIKQYDCDDSQPTSAPHANMDDEEYWHHEWARREDERAVVDVDVRGWLYNPHKGVLNRRNRLMVGLARRLSGIPAPTLQGAGLTSHEEHEEAREEMRIAKEAAAIEKRGQGEKEVANRGGYSEAPKDDDSDNDVVSLYPRNKSGATSPGSAPTSPALGPRAVWNTAADLTPEELAIANANLMARLGPFLTTPMAQLPITIFFYNDETSQSRTVTTNDSGHFSIRAALDFLPTHVRVLANESLSAIEPVRIIEDVGVSLISDIDDTIKHSNISLGAREIFRNTFIRDLTDLSVEGVKEWYTTLHDMGVQFHYCSNSPWQLFPVLATFFKGEGLPPGSLHLKQYSGMLQGIFEPVAERKKGTLERIMRDFPQRRFLLVGDSGEADLEVYTDLVQANPGRILAIFIRDVTTPEQVGYFDAAIDPAILRRKAPPVAAVTSLDHGRGGGGSTTTTPTAHRPTLPPRVASEPPRPEAVQGPVMGNLIDFSDEPEPMSHDDLRRLSHIKQPEDLGSPGSPGSPGSSALHLLGRKPPPPRPAKPLKLRGAPSDPSARTGPANHTTSTNNGADAHAPPLPPPPRRKPTPQAQRSSGLHPLAQTTSNQDSSLSAPPPPKSASSASLSRLASTPPPPGPPPPPRRRPTPSSSLHLSPRLSHRTQSSNSDVHFDALPPPVSGSVTPTAGLGPGAAAVGRKVDLWRRRLARAHEVLDAHGVRLYTWRRGDDVVLEAVGIVREALRDGKAGGRGKGKGKE